MTKRVLIEIRPGAATRAAELTMADVEATGLPALAGLVVDKTYEPVPLPGGEGAARAMGAEPETVIFRGQVADEAAEQALRNAPNVVGVWTDAVIAAFGGCGCSGSTPMESRTLDMSQESTGSEMSGADLFAPISQGQGSRPFNLAVTTPCPPTDCDYQTAKGTIADVARFLSCDRLWAGGTRGAGVVIGICDTGVDKSRIPAVIGGWSPNPSYPWGTDPGGHGSMCATDALGMCPEAKIYDIGVLKSTGDMTGLLSDALTAYNWALNQYRTDGTPQILSNSWGMFQKAWAEDYATNPNHPFTRKVVEVIDAGLIVTFAAGNCGQVCPSGKCGSDTGPGRSIWGANGHPKVITVGAANIRGEWIGYTSQGPAALDANKPDFCSPSHFQGWTACDNGTSAANPVCAGVIGLLRGHDPALTQDRAKKALQETAVNLCAPGWDPNSGFGMINAERAYNE